MTNLLSIRSYSRQTKGHRHSHHQLVLPLRGVINIEVGTFSGKVTPGECVVVKSNEIHHFNADTEARFVVADLDNLPSHIADSDTLVFSINSPLIHFLSFIEEQLKFQINKEIEKLMFATFYQLLSEQTVLKKVDPRIREAIEYIESHLSETLSITTLSSISCLSPTQFKKIFTQQTELTVTQYITKLRMEKAQALLLHTDFPIPIVAQQVGYSDISSFSRRFSRHFGLPPSKISH